MNQTNKRKLIRLINCGLCVPCNTQVLFELLPIFNDIGHGGSRDRKRGSVVQKWLEHVQICNLFRLLSMKKSYIINRKDAMEAKLVDALSPVNHRRLHQGYVSEGI